MKKKLKLIILMLTMLLTFSTSVSAVPLASDPTEPANNSPTTTYWYSQNVFTSWIQSPNDIDFWNFISPKTGYQELWILPPPGTTYGFGIYEYGASTPLQYVIASGSVGISSIYVPLVAGQAYTVMVLPFNGTYDDVTPYYIGHPVLFPY